MKKIIFALLTLMAIGCKKADETILPAKHQVVISPISKADSTKSLNH